VIWIFCFNNDQGQEIPIIDNYLNYVLVSKWRALDGS
jgi:hypothetical protein